MRKWAGPFAEAGEIVTCENGHEICAVAVPLHRETALSTAHFTDWKIPEPKKGSAIEPCPQCGGAYITEGPNFGGLSLHVSGEWRP